MRCSSCQHTNSRVLESRSAESGQSIRRRRECLSCQHRFTTYERIEFVPITVIKRDGKRESFDRSKLVRGLIRACEKTGLSSGPSRNPGRRNRGATPRSIAPRNRQLGNWGTGAVAPAAAQRSCLRPFCLGIPPISRHPRLCRYPKSPSKSAQRSSRTRNKARF